MAKLTFVAIEHCGFRDGSGGWKVLVDGIEVIPKVKSSDTDFANSQFSDVYEKLGITVDWDWDDGPYAT